MLMDRLHFLSRFVISPRKIGSLTPSSRYLVNGLLQSIPWNSIDAIIELGAGTGVVTEQIVQRRRPSCQAITFESDPKLHHMLKRNYPQLIHFSDAQDMTQQLEQIGIDQVDCVISCLPFTNFSRSLRLKILDEIQTILSPRGYFIAYQYSLQMKTLLQTRFRQVNIRFVPINLPPSFVYICRSKKI